MTLKNCQSRLRKEGNRL